MVLAILSIMDRLDLLQHDFFDQFSFSKHALSQIEIRNIKKEWVFQVSLYPDSVLTSKDVDGNSHYFGKISEFGNRTLRVVINESVTPNRIVTVFFDRRLK
jgi:hypothetical membrane protein